MFRHADHPDFCSHHAEQELKALGSVGTVPLAAELLGPVQDFRTHAAINSVLGNLWVQLAEGRIDPRRASVLSHLGRVIHQTVKPLGWEMIDRQPTASLQAALSAILGVPKPAKPRRAKPAK